MAEQLLVFAVVFAIAVGVACVVMLDSRRKIRDLKEFAEYQDWRIIWLERAVVEMQKEFPA